jgi:prophage regulatory protein
MAQKLRPPGDLPAVGYIRQSRLIGIPARKATNTQPAREAVPGILPISSATLWRGVKAGTFPAPVKLSEGVTAWCVEKIRAYMKSRVGLRGATVPPRKRPQRKRQSRMPMRRDVATP